MKRVVDLIGGLALSSLILSGSVSACSASKTLEAIQSSSISLGVAMMEEARARLRKDICAAVEDSTLELLSDEDRDDLASKVITAYVGRLAENRKQDPSLKTLLRTQAERDGLIKQPSAGWAAPVPRPYGWVNIDPADASTETFVVNGEDIGNSRRVLTVAGKTEVVGKTGGSIVCRGEGEAVAAATVQIACSGGVSP